MNDTERTYPTILEMFYRYEREQPGRLFLSEPIEGKARRFTWKEAGVAVRKMAAVLRSWQLPPRSRIAIIGKNSGHWILSDLAIMMAGHITVPVYPTVTAHTLRHILEHSESAAIFIGKLDFYAEIEPGIPASCRKVCFPWYPWPGCDNWDELVSDVEPFSESPVPDPHSLNCILYTSGTTGDPKGVMHTHFTQSFSLLTVMEALDNDFGTEVLFSYLPLSHIAERMVVEYAGIFTGSEIHFPQSAETFTADLQRTQPTIFLAVPRIWEKFREGVLQKLPQRKLDLLLRIPLVAGLLKRTLRRKLGLSRAKFTLSGASPIHPELQQWFARLGIIIQEAYGMTENMALTTINRKRTARFGTVGQGYPGVEIRLGKDNEIQVRSAASMVGYYKDPELTAASFEDGFLKTGDEGRFDKDGYLSITGRIKDQFKTSKGKYIAPAPIERMLLECPLIAQVCVVGSGESHPLGLCLLNDGQANADPATTERTLKNLLASVNERVEFHERLAKLVCLDGEWTVANGFLTPTLKIRRKVVDERYAAHYEKWLQVKNDIVRP